MEVTPSRRKVYLAFVVLAVLAGPVDQSVSTWFFSASPLPSFYSLAVASAAAGLALGLIAAVRRDRMPSWSEWAALVVLIAPQLCLVPFGPTAVLPSWLHGIGWGTALLLSLAAPLWLALLSAANIMQIEIPRATIAAAIVGIGAVFLTLPVDATTVHWLQLPALLLNLLLGIAVAASWAFARPRLRECEVASAAAAYLGLSAAGYLIFAFVYEPGSWRSTGWHMAPSALLAELATLVVSWCLWFWLLKNLTLGAFSMRMLANCAATLLPGFAFFGIAQWRMDAAFVISCIAIAVALRSTPAGEQPLSLGLANS